MCLCTCHCNMIVCSCTCKKKVYDCVLKWMTACSKMYSKAPTKCDFELAGDKNNPQLMFPTTSIIIILL